MARIKLERGSDTFFIELKDFIYAHTFKNYTNIICVNRVINDVRITIAELMHLINDEQSFKEHHIFKFNRNFIVNTDYKVAFEVDAKQDPENIKRDLITGEPLCEHIPWITLKYVRYDEKLDDEDNKSDDSEVKDKENNTEAKIKKGKLYEVTIPGTKVGAKELLKLETELLRESPSNFMVKSVGHSTLTIDIFKIMDTYPTANGHGYADLGLPSGTCWAVEDFKERTSQEYGKKTYSSVEDSCKELYETCEYYGFDMSENLQLQKEFNEYSNNHDLVSNYWRSNWRIPTVADFRELIDNCEWIWCLTQDEYYGALIVGPNGNFIFLDADNGSVGRLHEYWTGPLSKDPYENQFARFDVDAKTGKVKMTLHSRGYKPDYRCYLHPVFTNED